MQNARVRALATAAVIATAIGLVLARPTAPRGGQPEGDARVERSAVESRESRESPPALERAAPPNAPPPTGLDPPTRPADVDPRAAPEPPEEEAPEVQAVRAARRSPDGARALAASLASHDPVVVAEAADGLVAKGTREARDALLGADVRASAAPLAVIDALGKLAHADVANAHTVVTRLVALLEDAKRDGPSGAGRALQIYEALGDTGAAEATAVLVGELGDDTVPPAAKVLIASQLSRLPAPAPRAALLAARGAPLPQPKDAIDMEIQGELLAALDGLLAASPSE